MKLKCGISILIPVCLNKHWMLVHLTRTEAAILDRMLEHCFPAMHKIKEPEQEILVCTLLSRLHNGETEER